MKKEIAEVFVFKSDTGKGVYQTLLYVDGTLSCDCKGWIYKLSGTTADGKRTCKHCRMVEAGVGKANAFTHVVYSKVRKPQAVQQVLQPTCVRAFED